MAPLRSSSAKLSSGRIIEFGVDEAGRGPLAGPVVCAACYLPPGLTVEGVMDSKMIADEEAREEVYARLVGTEGVHFAVAKCEAAVVDGKNILQATLAAMRLVSRRLARTLLDGGNGGPASLLDCRGDDDDDDEDLGVVSGSSSSFLALVDGDKDPFRAVPCAGLQGKAIVKGDATVQAISAASVIAKVSRDRIMNDLDASFPQYNFKQHKGYGTTAHRAAILKHGWIDGLHRRSFNPVKSMILAGQQPAASFVVPRPSSAPSSIDDDDDKKDDDKKDDDNPKVTQDDDDPKEEGDLADLEDLGVADLRSRCDAAGLSSTVKRTEGAPGPGRTKAVLIERLRSHTASSPTSPRRRSKRLRRSVSS